MANFRIKVDLSEYFDDCRRESYIFLKQEWETVKSIQLHLSRLFSLPKNHNPPMLTTGEGVFLPSEESIKILNQYDTIRVCRNSPVATPADPRPKFYNRSNSTLLDHCNLPALFQTNDSPIVPAEVLKKNRNQMGAAKLKKSKLSINFDNTANRDKSQPSDDEEEEEEDEESVTPNLSQKKKRKRVRKRKPKAEANGIQSTPVANGNGQSVTTNGTKKKESSVKSSVNGKSNKHTKFAVSASESSSSDSDDVIEKSAEKQESLNISLKLRTEKIPPISRIIKGIRTSCPAVPVIQVEKESTDAIDCSSFTHVDDSVIQCEEEEEEAKPADASQDVNNKSAHLDTLRKNLGTYPALEKLPQKNDYIGFRILTMSENYVPELSEYIIGLVENVDEDTMDLEIVILAGNEELKQHQEGGKFSLPDCNDTLVDMDDNTLHINWIELKDVRLVNL